VRLLKRPLLLGTGWLCVGLGLLGVVLPLLPTTPFLLVAVWAFSKSSPELAEKIRGHRIAGPYVRDWQDQGVIPVQAKVLAVSMMAAAVAYMHFGAHAPSWAVGAALVVILMISAFIVTRPGRRSG
jgi:uncharacterized protein